MYEIEAICIVASLNWKHNHLLTYTEEHVLTVTGSLSITSLCVYAGSEDWMIRYLFLKHFMFRE